MARSRSSSRSGTRRRAGGASEYFRRAKRDALDLSKTRDYFDGLRQERVFTPSPLRRRRVVLPSTNPFVHSPNVNLSRKTVLPSVAFNRPVTDLTRPTLCQSRRARRRAVFASGAGGSKVRPPVFTEKSKVKC